MFQFFQSFKKIWELLECRWGDPYITANRNNLRFANCFELLSFWWGSLIYTFVSDEELHSPANPKDFQEVDVKEEPFEYDALSGDRSITTHSSGDAVSDAHNFDV